MSCPDAIARVIEKYMDVGSNDQGQAVAKNGANGNGLSKALEKLSEVAARSGEYVKKIPVNSLKRKASSGVAVDQACPDCGMPINHESGCVVCILCGYSKCG